MTFIFGSTQVSLPKTVTPSSVALLVALSFSIEGHARAPLSVDAYEGVTTTRPAPVKAFVPVGSEFGDFSMEESREQAHGLPSQKESLVVVEDEASIHETAAQFNDSENDDLSSAAVSSNRTDALSDDDDQVEKHSVAKIGGFTIDRTIEMAKYAELAYYQPHFFKDDDDANVTKGGMKTKAQNDAMEAMLKKLLEEGNTVRFFGSQTENAGLIIEHTDGRVTVAYHGTDTTKNLLTDANVFYAMDRETGGRFHGGFYSDFAESAAQVETHLRMIAENQGMSLAELGQKTTFTGHSLGASLATISGYWFRKVHNMEGVSVAAFAPARAMDYSTAIDFDNVMGKNVISVSKAGDPVPYAYNATIFGAKHVGQRIHLPANVEGYLPGIEHHNMTTYTSAFEEMSQDDAKAISDFQVYNQGYFFNPIAKARLWADYYLVNPTHKGMHWLYGWKHDGLKAKKKTEKDAVKEFALGDNIQKKVDLNLSTPDLEELARAMTISPSDFEDSGDDMSLVSDAFDASEDVKGGVEKLRKVVAYDAKVKRKRAKFVAKIVADVENEKQSRAAKAKAKIASKVRKLFGKSKKTEAVQ